MRGLRCFTSEL